MPERQKNIGAESKDNSKGDSGDSLYSRTHEDHKSGDQHNKAESRSIDSARAGGRDSRADDSLFNKVMADVLDKHPPKNQATPAGEASAARESYSRTKLAADKGNGGKTESHRSGENSTGSRENPKALDKTSGSGGEQAVKDFIKSAGDHAYSSNEAAFVKVANTLADDSALRKMVTDGKGNVTVESVEAVMKVAAGAEVHAISNNLPGPRELTVEQVQSLDSVRSHIKDAASFVAEAAVPGASIVSAALRSDEIGKYASSKIAKVLENHNVNLSTLSVDNAIREINRSVVDAYHRYFGDSKDQSGKGAHGAGKNLEKGGSVSQDSRPADGASKSVQNDGASEKMSKTEAYHPPEQRENTPLMADGEFSTVAKQVLNKIDKEHSGQVTKEQLAKALEDPCFKGKEAQAIAAMYQNFDGLHNLSKHEGLLDSKSVTAGDLDKYNEIQKAQNERVNDAYAMKIWAHKHLSSFDKDGGGSLGRAEIAAAIADSKTAPEDRKMLETIQKHYSEMGHFYESGVNMRAFDDYAANIFKDTSEAKLYAGVSASAYNVNKGQKPDISHELYADGNNPIKSINPDAIRQGSIGDCYFEASLAAVAKSNPELIKNSIKDNGDGTYTVTFPGAKDEPITVKAPTQAEQGLYNHGSPSGLWASVMEKAYGAYCQKHFWRRGPFNIGGGNTPAEGGDGGGRASGPMGLLTGSDVSTSTTLFNSQATIASELEKAFSDRPPRAVAADINNSFFGSHTADKFYVGHVYTITEFKPDGKGGGTLTIRNPWGGQDGTPDGTITISMEQFMKNFSGVAIQK